MSVEQMDGDVNPGIRGEYGRSVDRLVAERYRVIQELGKGGMGTVCRAYDEVLGREVAVKELRAFTDAGAPELAELRGRMRREARAAARIRHPGVVAVHDVAEQDGRPVIVMELVDGPSLADVLGSSGELGPLEAAEIGAKVAGALEAAHRAGVLHRDVKPGNILLGPEGRVVLTDFGIASMDDPGDGGPTRLTQSGALVGSLEYLAPERAQGQEPAPASDIWSLGATLYAAVEGGSPFQRTSTWTTLTAIVSEPLPHPERCGPLTPVLRRLLDKDPNARPTAREACELLEKVAGGASLPEMKETVNEAAPVPAPAAERSSTAGPTALPVGTPVPVGTPAEPPAAAPEVQGGRRRGRRREGSGRRTVLAVVGAVAVIGAAVAVGAALRGNDGPPGGISGTAAGDRPAGAASPPGAAAGARAPSDADGQVCTRANGGRYNCELWRPASTYDAAGNQVGSIKKGTGYFYCQSDLGRRETQGKATNVWWARTDDDNGNNGVWVSVVNITGASNNQPLPGLPTCAKS